MKYSDLQDWADAFKRNPKKTVIILVILALAALVWPCLQEYVQDAFREKKKAIFKLPVPQAPTSPKPISEIPGTENSKPYPTPHPLLSSTSPKWLNINKSLIQKEINIQYSLFNETINNPATSLKETETIHNLYEKFYYHGNICNENSYQQLSNLILHLTGRKVLFHLQGLDIPSSQKEGDPFHIIARGQYTLSGQFPGNETKRDFHQKLVLDNGKEWLFCGWE